QQQQRKRPQSLFERFTGPLWNHEASRTEEDTSGRGESSGGGAGGSFHGQKRQQAQAPMQQSLNIDAPSGNADDELDIPAFLRRQAN
ncbi:MAG TPA: hypothetical protein VIG74_01425, partial [Alphaproteobacteria bacterium]